MPSFFANASYYFELITNDWNKEKLLNATIMYNLKPMFLQVLADGADITKPYGKHLPIEIAFIRNRFDFAWELLERGFDPGSLACYGRQQNRLPLLQEFLYHPVLAHQEIPSHSTCRMAKLLILYGARIDGIDYFSTRPRAKKALLQFLSDTHQFYVNRILPFVNLKTEEAYQALNQAWLETSNTETDCTLQQCYLNKAQAYLVAAEKLHQEQPPREDHYLASDSPLRLRVKRRDGYIPLNPECESNSQSPHSNKPK